MVLEPSSVLMGPSKSPSPVLGATTKPLRDEFFAETVVLPICLIPATVIPAIALLLLHLAGIDL